MAAPTKEELDLIAKFRERLSDLELSDDQNSDMFLVKWIRARENKLDQSEKMLRTTLKWREDNDIDHIMEWKAPAAVTDALYVDMDHQDKDTNPLIILPMGRYDFRELVQSGEKDNAVTYFQQIWEKLTGDLMKGKVTKEGVPMTQFTCVVDMDKLGMKTVGSLGVIDLFKTIVGHYESRYPEILKQMFIINSSRVFQILFAIIKPMLSPRTFGKVHILTSQSKWLPELLQVIHSDQLPEFYGGTADSSLHAQLGYTMRKDRSPDDYDQVTVEAGGTHQIEVQVPKKGSLLKWDFKTESYDIEFSVLLKGEEVVGKKRVESDQGEYKCLKSGTYSVRFDNSYSRMRSKSLQYVVKVIGGDKDKK